VCRAFLTWALRHPRRDTLACLEDLVLRQVPGVAPRATLRIILLWVGLAGPGPGAGPQLAWHWAVREESA
jgi:hypothetical protein